MRFPLRDFLQIFIANSRTGNEWSEKMYVALLVESIKGKWRENGVKFIFLSGSLWLKTKPRTIAKFWKTFPPLLLYLSFEVKMPSIFVEENKTSIRFKTTFYGNEEEQ